MPKIGRDGKFNGTAFALDEKEISGPIEGTRGYYVLQVIEKQPIDENEFENQRETLRQQLLDVKRRTIYNAWLTNLKDQAEIKDYRHMFF